MIPLNDGYRASPVRSVTDTTAGSRAVTVSDEVSESRRISTPSPDTDSRPAYVTAGTPSRSASNAGTTPIPASVDAIPATTRSNPIRSTAAASTSDVANASDPCNASSLT